MTWWITDTSIGQRLKFVRRFRRLTQKELGLLMGYSEKTADVRIAQYEKNARTPNAETTASWIIGHLRNKWCVYNFRLT